MILLSAFLGISGGYLAGTLTGKISAADFIYGLQNNFIPYNVEFALIKSLVFAFIITSVAAYHGFHTKGGALEVGKSSTYAVVYSSILILIGDYILTQLLLV
jgi:phospholipid/cholesterol/gamma-HCH transport system permease protein